MEDFISRKQAIDALEERLQASGYSNVALVSELNRSIGYLMRLPSVQPEIIRCKDCIYQTESWSGIKYCEAHGDHIGKDYDYCSNARRKTNGIL